MFINILFYRKYEFSKNITAHWHTKSVFFMPAFFHRWYQTLSHPNWIQMYRLSIFYVEIIIMKLFAFARFEANILKSNFFSFLLLNFIYWKYCYMTKLLSPKTHSSMLFQFQCHLIKNSTPHRINFSIWSSSNNLVKFRFKEKNIYRLSNTQ